MPVSKATVVSLRPHDKHGDIPARDEDSDGGALAFITTNSTRGVALDASSYVQHLSNHARSCTSGV